MDSKNLTIVIVTFRSESKIFDCLRSIRNLAEIIVVENSNNNDFKKKLENKFSNLKCILTGKNLGYAVANNIGLRNVKTKYALVLNPDTILDENAIQRFLKSAKKQEDFWLMGPASDQMVELEFGANDLIEVNNLKGFAIFFNLSKFNNEFFDESKDYLGVHHPCHYLGWPPHNQPYGSFDRTNSRARVGDDDDLSTYWQGCLWGGKVPEIFAIMEELDSRTQLDLKDDIIALWHDESHLNKIFIENKDKVRTLPSDYAYPECFDDRVKDQLEPKIVHLAKNNSKYHS